MQSARRRVLQTLSGALLFPWLGWAQQSSGTGAGKLTVIRLNLPGPGSLPFLPLELISALGFDRELGARLVLRYKPSGIRALEDVLGGNADFAAVGFPTLPVLQSQGKEAVAIAPISGEQHVLQLIVRKDLAKTILHVGNLVGHTVAVSTGSTVSKTYSQMALEIILSAHGVNANQVRWLPTGQNWESVSGALISRAADVIFCEQPFPTRLIREGLGVSLLDLSDKRSHEGLTGIAALRSVLATSRQFVARPEGQQKAELLVKMLRRSLAWINTNEPTVVAQRVLESSEKGREDIVAVLAKTPHIYSADARFNGRQVNETDLFLRSADGRSVYPRAIDQIDSRWAGIQP
jgi:NitT/TauT family transport system substrate-binding protein